MTDEAGGAAPRRGFQYQDLAAACYFITDYPDFLTERPDKLYIERFDSDFAFILEDDEGKEQHYFEAKHIDSGELKWGEKFKDSVFPEFYRICCKHAEVDDKDRAYFHLVTNGAASQRVNKFISDAEELRYGKKWDVFKTRHERRDLSKLQSAISSNSQIENDGISLPDDIDDLYHTVWGISLHTPNYEELKYKLENYLRKCSPTNFRTPLAQIRNKISETDSGVIKRSDLKKELGIPLDPSKQSTSPNTSKNLGELRTEVEDISESHSETTPNTGDIRQERETVREYGERIKDHPETENTTINSSKELVDEAYGKLEQIEAERSATKAEIGQHIEVLLEEDSTTANSKEGDD